MPPTERVARIVTAQSRLGRRLVVSGHGGLSSGPGGNPPSLRNKRRAASTSACLPQAVKNSAVFMAATFSATAVVTN